MAQTKTRTVTPKKQSFGRELYGDVKGVVKDHPLISFLVGFKAFKWLTKPKKVVEGEATEVSTLDTVFDKLTDDSTLVIIAALGAVAYLFKSV